jgi:hypothetical protein
MTINPLYPILTKGIWLSPIDSTLRDILSDKLSQLVAEGKTDGILKQVDVNTESYYAYRFWVDTESAQAWIDYSTIIPADQLTSISIVDAAEVADI